jgi:hypothetical protein
MKFTDIQNLKSDFLLPREKILASATWPNAPVGYKLLIAMCIVDLINM